MIQTRTTIIAFGVILASVTAVGCAARGPVGARETVADYQLRDVSVTLAVEVDDGWLPRLDDEDDDAFNQRVAGSLEEILEQQVGSSLPGTTPVDILIVLDRITIASDVGRTLGSDSELGGTVQVVDVSSGLAVAETRIGAGQSSQEGFGIGGVRAGSFSIPNPLGFLISNAVRSALSDEVQTVVQRFGERLKSWLEN